MDAFTFPVIAVVVAVAILLSFLALRSKSESSEIDIEAGLNDPELVGPVSIARDVEYPGTRQPESGRALVRYDTTGNGGTPRVTKFILARDRSYLTMGGHYVLYEYRRENGSLESDKLIFPGPGLGGGVYSKVRLRFFDEQGVLVKVQYLREDGTTGLISDETKGVFQQFRLDGKSLHSEFFFTADGGQRAVYYRRDGKTVWVEKDEKHNARVYFDLSGKPVDLRFTRELAITESFGMGPDSEPVLYAYDNYHRQDGTLAYKQSWYFKWDKELGSTVHALGKVVVYDASGTKPVAEHDVPLDGATQRRVSDDVMFQGFIWNVWGTYDDESHDI
jgi:hypothetical protein